MNDEIVQRIKSEIAGHYPVMLDETLSILDIRSSKTYLDCTFGGGSHSKAILESANCKLVAIDQDTQANERAKTFKTKYGDRFEFYPINFSKLETIQTTGYAGILMDLGVSSFQLDEADRGFSFMRDGETDMRMDGSKGKTALEILEKSDYEYLEKILRIYGEEPRSRQVARAIIEARGTGKLNRTLSLAQVIGQAADKSKKTNPATRSFQAIRIATNDEIGALEIALPKAFDALESGGILAVISFHSLEDRIVKRFFKSKAGLPVDFRDSSYVQDRIKEADLLTRKAISASKTETDENPRSRSAKLRAIKKL